MAEKSNYVWNIPQEILNHCFDEVERFMTCLQQTAEAQSVLNQRKKKRSRKGKKEDQDGESRLSITSTNCTVRLTEMLWFSQINCKWDQAALPHIQIKTHMSEYLNPDDIFQIGNRLE